MPAYTPRLSLRRDAFCGITSSLSSQEARPCSSTCLCSWCFARAANFCWRFELGLTGRPRRTELGSAAALAASFRWRCESGLMGRSRFVPSSCCCWLRCIRRSDTIFFHRARSRSTRRSFMNLSYDSSRTRLISYCARRLSSKSVGRLANQSMYSRPRCIEAADGRLPLIVRGCSSAGDAGVTGAADDECDLAVRCGRDGASTQSPSQPHELD